MHIYTILDRSLTSHWGWKKLPISPVSCSYNTALRYPSKPGKCSCCSSTGHFFNVSWKPQLLCTSIQNQFDSIRTVQMGFTTKTFGPSRIPSQVSHRAKGSTAGIKDSADGAGMAPAMQTWSESSQCTCLTDRADWRHCLAIQNMSVSHQPQHILTLLISNISARVSAERIKIFSPYSAPSSSKGRCLVLEGYSCAGSGKEATLFPRDCTSSRGEFYL